MALWPQSASILRDSFSHRSVRRSGRRFLAAFWVCWALVLAGPLGPVSSHLGFVPQTFVRTLLAIAYMYLSVAAIDIILLVVLGGTWIGLFTEVGAITSILAVLLARIILTARLDAPDATALEVEDPGQVWNLRNLIAAASAYAIVAVVLIRLLPTMRNAIDTWARTNHLDEDTTFVASLVIAITAGVGITILVRHYYHVGARAADPLFTEVFWALVTVVAALIPVALRASWAPTMIGALAIPVVVARWRLSAHKVDRPQVGTTSKQASEANADSTGRNRSRRRRHGRHARRRR